MASKKNFVLRLDASIYAALEKWAADEFRSVNGQLEWLVHQQLKHVGRLPAPGSDIGTASQSDADDQTATQEP